MKKKIIYGLLFAVAMVTASSSFVSCKDYEGDDLAAIRERIAIDGINSQATLDELIRTQLSLAQAQLDNLFDAYSNMKLNPTQQMTGYQDKLTALQNQFNTASTIAGKVAVLNELTKLLTELNGTAESTGANKVPSAVDVIIMMWGDSLYDAYTTAFLAKERVEFLRDSLRTVLKGHSDSIKANDALSKDNKYRLDTLTIRANKLFIEAKSYADQASLNMYNKVMNELKAKMTKDSAAIYGKMSQDSAAIYNKIANESASIYAKIANDSAAIYAKIKADSVVLANAIKAAQDQLTLDRKADSTLFENKLAELDKARKSDSTKFEKLIAELDSTMKAEDAKLDKKFTDALAKLDSTMKAEDAKLAKEIARIDSAYQAGDSILTVRCNDIEAGYKAAVKDLQGQLDKLAERVTGVEQDIDNILGTLKKQISGVIIQGTYSPVFGYGSLPLGVQTNILAAYASKTTNAAEFDFPTYVGANYHNNNAVITGEDFDYVNDVLGQWPASVTVPANEILVDDKEGNAGTMYLTVNPTNVDFSGTNFKLVNSLGQESRIVLSKLNSSDKLMTFGWTRGTSVDKVSANGFYEVAATIKAEDALKMQPRFDKAGFKKAVTEALDGQRRLAVKDLARSIYNSLEPLDRFGVKAEWTDTLGKRSVTSALDIAAFSLEPLGFGFRVPNFTERYIRTIDKALVLENLHINLNIDPIVITLEDKKSGKYIIPVEIPLLALSPELFETDGNGYVYYNGYAVYEREGNYLTRMYGVEEREGYAYIDFTPMFEELFGQFNATFANFNNETGNLNKKIDEIAGMFNSYVDKANSYINRGNGVLEKVYDLVKRAGDLVQPVLLWSDGTNVGELGAFVSGNYAVGTRVPKGGQVKLAATSYSLELLAPSYKKSLIVTNAYKGGLSAQGAHGKLEKAVKALNEQIKAQGFDLFSGQSLKNQFTFTANEEWAGITFEIAYTAVDFEGKCAGRKFYITVGE